MTHLLVATQVLSQDMALSWPVAVAVLAGAAVVIETRVKTARLEADLERAQSKLEATMVQVAAQQTMLGEIKAGIDGLRDELRELRRVSV